MIAWVLNFDADLELAHGEGYTVSQKVEARLLSLVQASGLVGPEDVVLYPHHEDSDPTELLSPQHVGRCWCPTPSALERLLRVGVEPPKSPSFEILRTVNHRSFIEHLVPPLPWSTTLRDATDFGRHQSRYPNCKRWRLKRPHGFSGQGHLVCEDHPPPPHQLRWIRDGLRRFGSLSAEPDVDRLGDYSLHGYLEAGGRVTWGEPCQQQVDDRGKWLCATRSSDLSDEERMSWFEQAEQVAGSLYRAGYHGPFGLDAFRYQWEGKRHFQTCCDLNARHTMAWATGTARGRSLSRLRDRL